MSDTTRALEGAAPVVAEELGDDLRQLAHNANDALNGIAEATGLSEKVQENPYGMVAAALGAGYVAGGGLFSPLTMRILQLGLKAATIPAVQERLFAIAESAIDGALAQSRKITSTDSEE